MPRKSEPKQVDEADGVPTVVSAASISCRKCGESISYDAPDAEGIVRCPCGVANLVDIEEA